MKSHFLRILLLVMLALGTLSSASANQKSKILIQKAVKAYKEENFLTAKKLYDQACTLGNMTGCSGLGTLYERGLGVIRNLQKAQEYYSLACKNGDSFGCFHAQMLESGELAVDYHSTLCDEEVGSSCLRLANLYYHGRGVAKDKKNAVLYYQKACSLKNAEGCFNLGVLYNNQEGDLDKNPEIALAYFYLAKQYLYLECKAKQKSSCQLLKSMENAELD